MLLAALKGGDEASRVEAAMVLGRIGGAQKALAGRIVRFSISATRDSDSRVRAAAVRSIGKIATLDDELFRLMCRALTDPVPHVKVAALRSSGGMWEAPGVTRYFERVCSMTQTAEFELKQSNR